jgi:hypothetical protein
MAGPKESLRPLTGKLPSADQSERELHAGMRNYDGDRAERAIVALAREQGTARVGELLFRYGARDWFFIGHLPIWAANCWRPLETIGWQHAEPILRVVIRDIVGDQKDIQLQPYEANRERVRRSIDFLPPVWTGGNSDEGFATELLDLWRESTSAPRSESPRQGEFPGAVDSRMTPHAVKKREAACDMVVAALKEGKVGAADVWDAVHLAVGEMMLCAPKGPEPGHSTTATNALHYAFQLSASTETRLLILLQAVAWLFHFRENMEDKGWLQQPRSILDLAAVTIPDEPQAAAEDLLARLSFGNRGTPGKDPAPGYNGVKFNDSPWRQEAARKAFSFAQRFHNPELLVSEAWRLLPVKANWDPHRIKFPIAAWENYGWVSDR